jgi:hypothetical protein
VSQETILVTGAAGSVGSTAHTAIATLLEQGHRVRAMVRKLDARAGTLRDMGAEVVVADMLDIIGVRASYDLFDGGRKRAVLRRPAHDASDGPRAGARGHVERRRLRRGAGRTIRLALPAASLADFVSSLAHRIASFPEAGHIAAKDRVNAIALAPVDDFHRDSDLFGEEVRKPEAQRRILAVRSTGFGRV